MAAALLRGDCRAVCDGSFKRKHGTAAFVLHGHRPIQALRGCNITHGPEASQCAYRSELGGLVGVVTTLELLCKAYDIPSGRVLVKVDCESLIKRLSSTKPLQVQEAHFDLLNECRSRIQELPVTVKLEWVEGHQDDGPEGSSKPLDWWALQNIAMDEAAKDYWQLTHTLGSTNHMLKHEFFAAAVAHVKLTSFNKEAVHSSTNEAPIRSYWQTKHSISDQQWEDINWKAAQAAHHELPVGQRRFHAKFSTSHIATGKMMLLRKQWPHSKCPRCGSPDEDTRHVLQCPASTAQWTKSLQALKEWMTDQHTDPILAASIMRLLRGWRSGNPTPLFPSYDPQRLSACQAQADLGAWNTFLGRISQQITDCQHRYYQSQGSRRTGHRWTVALITKLQMVAWDMWDHRNGILHEDPLRHHMHDDLLTTNSAIAQEWEQGPRGLLPQDQFLFRSRPNVEARTLQGKWEWLESVTLAREAAQADSEEARAAHAQERRGIRNWLLTGTTRHQA